MWNMLFGNPNQFKIKIPGNSIYVDKGNFKGDIKQAENFIQNFCNQNKVSMKSDHGYSSDLYINEKKHELSPYGIDLDMMIGFCGGKVEDFSLAPASVEILHYSQFGEPQKTPIEPSFLSRHKGKFIAAALMAVGVIIVCALAATGVGVFAVVGFAIWLAEAGGLVATAVTAAAALVSGAITFGGIAAVESLANNRCCTISPENNALKARASSYERMIDAGVSGSSDPEEKSAKDSEKIAQPGSASASLAFLPAEPATSSPRSSSDAPTFGPVG